MTNDSHGFFRESAVVARCRRCGNPAGHYFTHGEHQGWERGWCSCTPPPRLPEGDELVAEIVRSLRRRKVRDLPFQIRV
jgi:hypothetical protein